MSRVQLSRAARSTALTSTWPCSHPCLAADLEALAHGLAVDGALGHALIAALAWSIAGAVVRLAATLHQQQMLSSGCGLAAAVLHGVLDS